MKRALEEIGWRKLKDAEIMSYKVQRDGYCEIFCSNKNGFEIAIYGDGGITISGKFANMEPNEVSALIEDIQAISKLKDVVTGLQG